MPRSTSMVRFVCALMSLCAVWVSVCPAADTWYNNVYRFDGTGDYLQDENGSAVADSPDGVVQSGDAFTIELNLDVYMIDNGDGTYSSESGNYSINSFWIEVDSTRYDVLTPNDHGGQNDFVSVTRNADESFVHSLSIDIEFDTTPEQFDRLNAYYDSNNPSDTLTYQYWGPSVNAGSADYVVFGAYGYDGSDVNVTTNAQPIPEPVTVSLLTLGGLSLLRWKRRRFNNVAM